MGTINVYIYILGTPSNGKSFDTIDVFHTQYINFLTNNVIAIVGIGVFVNEVSPGHSNKRH